MTWAHSPVYGTAVALGPTQQAVYAFVLGVTNDGRRPTFTLAGIADRTGKPVSSVHQALGRLRALGLIGFDARMGRTGGHRLWRVARRSLTRSLDAIRHRLAIARITRRWYAGPTPALAAEPSPEAGTLWGGPTHGTGPGRESSDGGRGTKSPSNDQGPSPFRDAMRRAGFTPWWRLADDPRPVDPDASDSRSGGSRPGHDPDLLAALDG